MPLLVRPSRDDDLPAMLAIYEPAVLTGTASWELTPPDLAEFARRRAAIIEGGYPWLVAERDGKLAGYAYAGAYRPRAAYRATVEDSIYIAPTVQGGGIGKALLGALIEDCAQRGFRQMIAVIGDGMSQPQASLRLHRAFGFELVGIARAIGFKHGRWLDQVLMQRPLGPGDGAPLRDAS